MSHDPGVASQGCVAVGRLDLSAQTPCQQMSPWNKMPSKASGADTVCYLLPLDIVTRETNTRKPFEPSKFNPLSSTSCVLVTQFEATGVPVADWGVPYFYPPCTSVKEEVLVKP